MTLDERVDRMERLWLLATRDVDGYLGVGADAVTEMDRLIRQLRADHPAVSRSGGQLILAPSLSPLMHTDVRRIINQTTCEVT